MIIVREFPVNIKFLFWKKTINRKYRFINSFFFWLPTNNSPFLAFSLAPLLLYFNIQHMSHVLLKDDTRYVLLDVWKIDLLIQEYFLNYILPPRILMSICPYTKLLSVCVYVQVNYWFIDCNVCKWKARCLRLNKSQLCYHPPEIPFFFKGMQDMFQKIMKHKTGSLYVCRWGITIQTRMKLTIALYEVVLKIPFGSRMERLWEVKRTCYSTYLSSSSTHELHLSLNHFSLSKKQKQKNRKMKPKIKSM